MGVTLTDVLLFGKAQSDDVDNATLVIYRRNIMRWSAVGGYLDIIVKGVAPLSLPDAIADSLSYVKAFGGTEQRNIPQPYTQVNYVTNTAQTAVDTGIMIDFAKNYEFEVECRAVSGSWYILQSRASASGNVTGIHGATSGSTIILVVGNVTVCTSAITRTVGNKLYVKATLNAGTATLYVKDETANTEDTQTGSYGTSQPNPTASVYLLGNAGGQYADINSDIYMARIKENDTVVMDYVPARQVATAGFYDTVSGTFKTALTPANLSADGNTVPTPDAPMDIVSNNGALKAYVSATGTATQSPAPAPTAPVYPVFYQKGDLVLRRVGDYADSYNATTHEITRRVGVKVLDGTEGWINSGGNAPYTLSIPDMARGSTIGSNNVFGFCSHFQAVSNDSSWATYQNMVSAAASNANLLFRYQNNTSTLDNFTQFLADQYAAGTPVTIYYPLADETTETVDNFVYTDGTQETINVHGKNMLNQAARIDNYYINNDGGIVAAVGACYSAAIPVVVGQKYTVSMIVGSTSARRILCYKGDTFVSSLFNTLYSEGDEVERTVTIPSGADNIRLSYRQADTDVQIEKGETATTYEPYYNGGTATAEMLLKVGDYQDIQSIIDGVVTRNVGVKVIDGTENWEQGSAGGMNAYGLTKASLGSDSVVLPRSSTDILCTHYETVNIYAYNKLWVGNNSINWMINLTDMTLEQWKAYLTGLYTAGTPVIIVYPLATATTESVTGQTLQVTDGDNTLEITQASLTGLELEAEYQAAVSLTIQEVQDANLDPNVEVTII